MRLRSFKTPRLVTIGKPKPKQREEAGQIALITWARYCYVGEETLGDLLVHCPNGGQRHAVVAAKLKAMGAKPGIPDLQLPMPVKGYVGGWWELKDGKNKPTETQLAWHARLRAWGHYVGIYWDWREAAWDIVRYARLGPAPVRLMIDPRPSIEVVGTVSTAGTSGR